ncbi:D-tyrosyl-tRNA(Tyr) deacylase [Rhodobacter sp. SGA-6-6]|uniref:D-aminoacyl-tRNA deacylase n=1 Tax=Rhodobacter sp. SGA-6-6 TaxID=2710882 RepID=UPI0013E9D6E8|nr:D-tyrosyl-tRNA(Tyr) deacylase [Rhodobacter sp. SGA-6-6]
MRAVLQRVSRAQVSVEGEVVGRCGPGLMILVCAMQGDGDDAPARLAAKVAKMRIFRDDQGKMNLSVRDIGGSALVVSQFTLAADLRGNRPGFSTAAAPEEGKRLYEAFAAALAAEGVPVETGVFGAEMAVELVNDGPVTIWIDSAAG